MVVWLSVRAAGTVCKVEGDVQVVNKFHVCLYGYVKSMSPLYCDIRDIDIIMHSRKSLLFDKNTAWIKKNNSSFDVSMGSYDGAEVCELIGLFILNDLCNAQ